MTYRTWLSRLRENKQISQAELARQMGVTRQTVHGWLTGSQTPDRDNIFRLAKVLGPEVITNFEAEASAKGVA